MNQTIETILHRRSIRNFAAKPIKEEDIRTIVNCALHAPSARGLQTWEFTVVENKDKIRRLAAAMGEALGNPSYNMYDPQVLIIPSNKRDSLYGKEDNACAMENIFLAAWSLGIGSVWINQLRDVCDVPQVRKILDEFQIPSDHVVYGLAALGYSDETPLAPKERIGKTRYIK
ncbi:MAG TPA: nitroreductase family protein [Candidatus Cottocaccamicrobium excrementipullorum]|nr:nitroreductase family protein [Candidatus Cottocaccamicrobium excrementipullorum]